MDWARPRRIRRHADEDRGHTLRGFESLEGRQLLAAGQEFGMDAVSCPPAIGAITEIAWNGHLVAVRADRWNGRLNEASLPNAALDVPVADWTVSSLGGGFFSLATPGAGRQEVLAWAARTPGIVSLEPDFVLQGSSLPNDPSFTSQWSLANAAIDGYGVLGADIHAAAAWTITTGSRSVVVAVIDSGIDLTHPDLAANIWTNPGETAGNGIDDDHNGFIDDVHGWNFAARTNDVQDGYGHGTHVSGIIGAVGNNGLGMTGINWQVSIMPLRFQDNFGVGDTGGAIAALNYATMMRRDFGINVVVSNNSWGGGTGVSELLREAIRAHGEAGITFVAAAGNSGVDSDLSPRYPAGFDLPNVISVAATDRFDTLAGFSNYGATTVDLGAPGVGIFSTRPNAHYASMNGTSQAAPQVTGVVALLAAAKPDITVAQVRAAVLSSVDPLPGLAGKTVSGGRLDAAAALAWATGWTPPIDTIPPVPNLLPIGGIDVANPVAVSGWALDPNIAAQPITVQLWVDGRLATTLTANTPRNDILVAYGSANHGYAIALPLLPLGTHLVEVKARDPETGLFLSLGQRSIVVSLPVGAVEIATRRRLAGWAFSSRAAEAAISIRVAINGRHYGSFTAGVVRPDLTPRVGSGNHGFDVVFGSKAFRRGSNTVKVWAIDPLTGESTMIGKRIVRR